MKMVWYSLYLSLFTFFLSCSQDDPMPPSGGEVLRYVHVAHLYEKFNFNIVDQISSIDFQKYDMRLLGGDLAWSTSIHDSSMTQADAVFDLGNEKTLWALGNHDDTNIYKVMAYTKRAPFYTYHNKGITYLVLDTQDSLCHMVGDQLQMIREVVDTMSTSSHLVLLHHKLIWMNDGGELEDRIDQVCNGPLDTCSWCLNPNNFYQDVYPMLKDLKERTEMEVICVGGDIGLYAKEFAFRTEDDIHFLASGMNYNDPKNVAIVFEHDVDERSLIWSFVPMDRI